MHSAIHSLAARLVPTLPKLGAFALAVGLGIGAASTPVNAANTLQFNMQRSKKVADAGCLLNAKGSVWIEPEGEVEVMHVKVQGLPPKAEFDFFVIQIPGPPFGLSWYQGDIETDEAGVGTQTFIGRFNRETFIVAPGVAPAPLVHNSAPNADAYQNVAQPGPIHTLHLGLWFNKPSDAVAAGCPGDVTPFNGDHNAGIQVLNTGNFPANAGPLGKLK